MFATPSLPMTENLLSREEVREIHRKMQSLRKLYCHPRAQTVEIMPFVMQIECYYNAVLQTETWVHRESTRQKFYFSQKWIAPYENIVIKYVLHGEELTKLVAEANRLFTAS